MISSKRRNAAGRTRRIRQEGQKRRGAQKVGIAQRIRSAQKAMGRKKRLRQRGIRRCGARHVGVEQRIQSTTKKVEIDRRMQQIWSAFDLDFDHRHIVLSGRSGHLAKYHFTWPAKWNSNPRVERKTKSRSLGPFLRFLLVPARGPRRRRILRTFPSFSVDNRTFSITITLRELARIHLSLALGHPHTGRLPLGPRVHFGCNSGVRVIRHASILGQAYAWGHKVLQIHAAGRTRGRRGRPIRPSR